MAGRVEPRSSCSPVEIAQLRAEARRDLKALLVISGVAGVLIITIGLWRGPGALWPVWGTIGTTMLVALALGMWAAYLRDCQALGTDKHRAATSRDMRQRVGVETDNA